MSLDKPQAVTALLRSCEIDLSLRPGACTVFRGTFDAFAAKRALPALVGRSFLCLCCETAPPGQCLHRVVEGQAHCKGRIDSPCSARRCGQRAD
jgi:hypothetical protein